jgi:uncharacterized membrane protein
MRQAFRSLGRPQVHRKAAAREQFAVTNGVADHISRTLLHQGYAELGEAERDLIDRIVTLAPHTAAPAPKLSPLDRVADYVTEATRSWWFVGGLAMVVVVWMLANSSWTGAPDLAFDPYPYNLLSFALSMIASVQGPIILISQHHRAAVDRVAAEYDTAVAVHSKMEILRLHKRLDRIERGLISQVRMNADPRELQVAPGSH